MPIQTPLSNAPYFDDFDQSKQYYKVLFKGGLAVQMRELNQIQSILQNQMERFGDNIFSVGTIVSGCNFQFYSPYSYIKLPDIQSTGDSVNPSEYLGRFVTDDSTGLKAYVVNYLDGYELSAPDLKTLYVHYINAGNDGNTSSFVPGNNITITDSTNPINGVNILNGGAGFSNTDQVVILPTLVVNVVTGTFTSSDYLVNHLTAANVEITAVDTSSLPGKSILFVKPRVEDLTNSSVNSTSWSFSLYNAVANPAGSATGVVEMIYGYDAQAKVITNAIGAVQDIVMLNRGKNYKYGATATVKTSNTSATVGTLDLSPQNFVAKIRLPSDADTVGNGYAFGVGGGQIYQQGHFLLVEPQTVVVSKYTSTPNNLCVGFNTEERIVDATEDSSLYENALGYPNEKAPGADRLKLSPNLVLKTKEQARANNTFFTLVEWNDGKPAIQNPSSAYSRIGDFIAQGTYDSSGNFVLDAFQVTTEAIANTSQEGRLYTAVIDPGQGYINGKKVQTLSNYKIDMQKGLDTKTSNNSVSLNYGNYVRVNYLGGQLDFSAGSQVDLYDRPAMYGANTSALSAGVIAPQGQVIGTSRIRSLEVESGYPGTTSAVYKLYLFDIQMNPGKNFKDVQGVYWDGATYTGIADVVLTYDATTASNVAIIYDTSESALLFRSGAESLKASNNSTYTFRTTGVINTAIDTATITISLSDPNEYFPWEGELSSTEMGDLIVVPVEDTIKASNNAGTISCNTTSATINGNSTDFSSVYDIGDYVEITDDAANVNIRRVTGIINATSMLVDSPPSFIETGHNHRRVFPKNVPVPFGQRSGLYANVDGTGKVLTLEFRYSNSSVIDLFFGDNTLETQVSYDVEKRGASASTKMGNRNKYVKIAIANSVGQRAGPWCLGVPDAFRLRAVTIGNSSVNASSDDITSHFYIDHNQNADYMGLSYLYLRPKTNIHIAANNHLLVCFDYFTRDNEGYFDTSSYLRTTNTAEIAVLDSLHFDQLSRQSAASSWEVPEIYTADGQYWDLYNTLDFRPTAANTVAPTSSPVTAPINPSDTVTMAAHSKFPRPNAVMRTRLEQYLGRVDDVYIGQSGRIFILKGIPDINPRNRYQSNHPKDSLRLQTLHVPPYPNMAATGTPQLKAITDTGMGNEQYMQRRIDNHSITPFLNTSNLQTSQPMVYTMEDIASLERRIADLEYYVTLSLLETNITNKIIPSSVNPALDRFKFGFFADGFESLLYSDLANPQYAASIEVEGSGDIFYGAPGNPFNDPNSPNRTEYVGGLIGQPTLKMAYRLVPPKRVWSLKHFTENVFYIDQEIIEQTIATTNPPDREPEPCVVIPVDIGVGANNNAQYSYYLQVNRAQSTVWIDSSTGVANIYFDVRAGAAKGFGGKIEVLSESGDIVATTRWAQQGLKQLGPNDIFFLSTNPDAAEFDQALNKQEYRSFERLQGALEDYATGSGKLTWKTPLGGGRFLIRTETTDDSILYDPSWKILVEFPSLYSAENVTVNDPDCSPLPPAYQGSLESGSMTMVTWACSNIFRTQAAGYKAFVLIGTGLKPKTVHKLYLDTVPWSYIVPLIPEEESYVHATIGLYGEQGIAASIASSSINGLYTFGNIGTDWVRDVPREGEQATATFFANEENTILKTDRRGRAVMLVFFPLEISGWFSQDFNAPSYQLDLAYETPTWNDSIAAQSLIQQKLLTPTYGSSGYTTLVLMDATGSSQAVRVFANRTPQKTIPHDARGAI